MLFRGTGLLCTATICQAFAPAADGQTGEASHSPPDLRSLGLLLDVIDILPII
jgi:hypothetical protein